MSFWSVREARVLAIQPEGKAPLTNGSGSTPEQIATTGEPSRLAADLARQRRLVEALEHTDLRARPGLPGLDVATRYEPVFEGDGVGGDFFDFIPLSGRRLGVALGDACGKGRASALYALTAKRLLRALAFADPDPGRVLRRLDEALSQEMGDGGLFLTLVFAIVDLDRQRVTYSVAGHPPPVLYDPASRRCKRLTVTGGLLGAGLELHNEAREARFAPGGVLVLFTDGVTEAHRSADPDNDGGVSAILEAYLPRGADTVAQGIFEQARMEANGRLHDDLAVVVLHHTLRR